MFEMLKNVYDSVVRPCTRDLFHGVLDDPRVEENCAALAENEKAYEEGRKTKKEHDDCKAKHKSLLPAFLLQGMPKDGRRKSQAGYIPTGLAMMDYDGLPRPQEYFEQKVRPLLERPDIRICWVHVTPSGRGHAFGPRPAHRVPHPLRMPLHRGGATLDGRATGRHLL